jgi:hypothetical protein
MTERPHCARIIRRSFSEFDSQPIRLVFAEPAVIVNTEDKNLVFPFPPVTE